jgi:hypothetical protein
LREKVIDILRRLGKSPLSFQVHAGRGDPITLGIENRDPITIIVLVMKYKLVSVMAMSAGRHAKRLGLCLTGQPIARFDPFVYSLEVGIDAASQPTAQERIKRNTWNAPGPISSKNDYFCC